MFLNYKFPKDPAFPSSRCTLVKISTIVPLDLFLLNGTVHLLILVTRLYSFRYTYQCIIWRPLDHLHLKLPIFQRFFCLSKFPLYISASKYLCTSWFLFVKWFWSVTDFGNPFAFMLLHLSVNNLVTNYKWPLNHLSFERASLPKICRSFQIPALH